MITPVQAGASFAAGLASFFTPCVLPLLPGYLSLISGLSSEELLSAKNGKVLKRTVVCSFFFVAGFALVFSLLGLSASAMYGLVLEFSDYLSRIAGIVLLAMGLHLSGFLSVRFLHQDTRGGSKIRETLARLFRPGIGGAFAAGIAFGAGWSPCIGPVLAGILAMAAAAETASDGFFLLLIYSAGLGVPFIAAGLATEKFIAFFSGKGKFLRWVCVVSGLALAAVGVLLIAGKFNFLARFFG